MQSLHPANNIFTKYNRNYNVCSVYEKLKCNRVLVEDKLIGLKELHTLNLLPSQSNIFEDKTPYEAILHSPEYFRFLQYTWSFERYVFKRDAPQISRAPFSLIWI